MALMAFLMVLIVQSRTPSRPPNWLCLRRQNLALQVSHKMYMGE